MTIGRIFEQRDQIGIKFSLSSFMFFRDLGVANVATAARQRKQCTENMSNPPASLFQNGGEMLCKDVQSDVSNTVISLHCRCTKTGSKALILEMNQCESCSKGTHILRTEQRVSMQVQFLLPLHSPKGGKECLSATAPITSNSQPSFVFK
jgi:hypothetical protein